MVRFRWPVKVCLFLSSYVPLYLILAIELIGRPPLVYSNLPLPLVPLEIPVSVISILFLSFSILLIFFLWFLLRYHSDHRIKHKRCDRFQQRNELISSYLLVYVFVFAGLNFNEISNVLIFIIFFSMLAVLQMRSEMLHINPLLGLGGYRVYQVESKQQSLLVISKERLTENIIIPESQSDVSEPEYFNIELIQLGPNTYMTPNNDK